MQNRKPKQTSDRLFSARPLIELIFLVRVWGKSSPRGACHGDTPWTPARARARETLLSRTSRMWGRVRYSPRRISRIGNALRSQG